MATRGNAKNAGKKKAAKSGKGKYILFAIELIVILVMILKI